MKYSKEQVAKFRELERELDSPEKGVITVVDSGVFTYVVPAKRGYYYLAVEASNSEEAKAKAEEVAVGLPQSTGYPNRLSIIRNIESLVINPAFKERFREFGYAHSYHKERLPSYSERHGHKGFLPR